MLRALELGRNHMEMRDSGTVDVVLDERRVKIQQNIF